MKTKATTSSLTYVNLMSGPKSLQHMVPELGEMWARLRDAKLFQNWTYVTVLWQMGLHPKNRHKTSFSCEYGTFQYRVLPMRLLTASAAFQRWVEGRLKKHNLLWQRVNIGDIRRYILRPRQPMM